MKHPATEPHGPLTSTRAETRRTLGLLKWPLFGALIAGGALLVARVFGPKVARDIGDAGGEGFAEGVARVQQQFAALQQQLPISGERETYAGAPHPGAYRRERKELADYLAQFPGFAGAGVTIRDPAEPGFRTVYEVRWLRGYPIPMLPPMVKEFPVKLEIVDALPVPQPSNRANTHDNLPSASRSSRAARRSTSRDGPAVD